MARIGIYGGSFNPVHFGHIGLVKWVLEHSDLDEIWMLVSPKSPHKTEKLDRCADGSWKFDLDTNYDERVAAAKEAVKDAGIEKIVLPDGSQKQVVVSDFERNLPLPSYTANTLRELKRKYPENEFSLIIGEDNWDVFNKWREWEYILKNYRVFVYPRKLEVESRKLEVGSWKLEVEGAKNVVFLKGAPYFDISSTEIRKKMQKDLHRKSSISDAADCRQS